MRKRINRACIASSENYSSSKKAHKAMLKENHVNNNALFLIINTTPTPKTLSPLERFEKGLKRQLEEFKLISMKKLLIFALGMKYVKVWALRSQINQYQVGGTIK